MVRHQNGKPTPSYKNHRALDDKAGVITAVRTTTGAVDEASELFELIERHERVTASKTKVAVADSRYGNTANLIALAQRKIRAHVADLRCKLRNPRSQGIYSPAARSDRKRRQWFQERNFGEASVEHGFKRARWRGLWRQSIQAYHRRYSKPQDHRQKAEESPLCFRPRAPRQ